MLQAIQSNVYTFIQLVQRYNKNQINIVVSKYVIDNNLILLYLKTELKTLYSMNPVF